MDRDRDLSSAYSDGWEPESFGFLGWTFLIIVMLLTLIALLPIIGLDWLRRRFSSL